ncbi:MAG TPA: four helix bundle protein, partial [Lacunisphaera sp.]|nr:four helix bundle protein [Lacunisphaera sp.]
MKNQELKDRTKHLALRVIRLTDARPRKMAADVLGRHVPRSATSVVGNYRSAGRARSRADLISKMGIVGGEAD